MLKFWVRKKDDGRWYWTLVDEPPELAPQPGQQREAPNLPPRAYSAEGYATKTDCETMISRIKTEIPYAKIEEATDQGGIPSWVARRAEASQERVFEKLCQQVKDDVAEINDLILGPRNHTKLSIDDLEPRMLRVLAEPGSPRQQAVVFHDLGDNKSIRIESFFRLPREPTTMLLTSEWDAENQRRFLFLSGEQKPVVLETVSQRALEPFLPEP